MNNNCEYAGDRCCLCSACQSMRKALEGAENISTKKIDELFMEAKGSPRQEEGVEKV